MSEGNVTDASSALSVRVPKDTVGNASLDGDSPPSTGAEMSESYKQACLESATKEIETSEMIATAEASFEHAMKANDGKTAIEARSRILTGKKLSLYYYVNKAENGLAYKIYELSANASDPAGSDNTSAQQSTTTGSTGARGRNGYAIEVLPQVSQSQGRKHGSRGSSRKSTGATHGFERNKVISDYWPWPDTEAAKSAKKKYEATWDNTMDSVYDAKRQMDEQGVRHFKIGVDVLVSLQAAKGLDPADLPDHDPTQTIGREAYTNYGKIREAGLSDPCAFGSGFRLLAGLPATLEGLAASNKRKGPDPPGDSMAGTATETTDPAVGTMTSDTADLSLVPMGYKHADKSVTTLARTLAEDSADTTDGTVGRLTSKAADAGKEDVKRMTSEQVSHAVDGWVCSMDDLRSKVSSGNCSSLPSIIRTATQGFGPGYVDAEEKYGEILENARITYPDGTQMFNAPQAFSRVAAESVCPRSEVEIAAREEEEAAREEQAAREERRARRREEAEAQSTQGSVMEIEDTPALSKDEETIHGAQPDNDTATPDSTSGHANIGDLSINDGEDDAAQSTGAEAVTPVPVNDDQSAFDGKSEIDNKTSGGAPVLA